VLAGPATALAQFGTTETDTRFVSETRDGAEYRPRLAAAVAAIRTGDLELASEQLGEIGEYCKSVIAAADRRVVSVANAGEFTQYLQSLENPSGVAWVDFVCPSTYQMQGFVSVNQGEFERARAVFEESLELDPGNELALGELRYIDQLEVSPEPQ
jgi:Flp pilus assembly protein TadD